MASHIGKNLVQVKVDVTTFDTLKAYCRSLRGQSHGIVLCRPLLSVQCQRQTTKQQKTHNTKHPTPNRISTAE
ncbi:hypothetical protein J6590_033605, partial [Homalodisca vitripennis]